MIIYVYLYRLRYLCACVIIYCVCKATKTGDCQVTIPAFIRKCLLFEQGLKIKRSLSSIACKCMKTMFVGGQELKLVTRRHLNCRNDCSLVPATCAVWPSSHQNNSLLQAHPVRQPQIKACRWKRLPPKNFAVFHRLGCGGSRLRIPHFFHVCLSVWLSYLYIYLSYHMCLKYRTSGHTDIHTY